MRATFKSPNKCFSDFTLRIEGKHGWSLQIKWEYDIISIWNEVNSKIAKRTPFRVATSKGGFSHVR